MGFVSDEQLATVRSQIAALRTDSKRSLRAVRAVLVKRRQLPPIDRCSIDEAVAKWRQSGSIVNLIEKNRETCRLKYGRSVRAKTKQKMKSTIHQTIAALVTNEIKIEKEFKDFDLFFKHNIQQSKMAIEEADFWINKRLSYQSPIEQLVASNTSIKAQLVNLGNDLDNVEWLRCFLKTVKINKDHNGRRVTISDTRPTLTTNHTELEDINANDVLDALLELEEQNLKVIENILLDGESIQEQVNSRKMAIRRGKRETKMLKQQIDLIKMNISRTDEKSKELEFYCSMFNSGLRDNLNDEVDEIERMLAKFEKKIREAFCFINPDMDELDVNPVIMLGGIETRVYEFIEQIENTDPLVFERMQRDLEREKRKAENQETEEQLKLRRLKRQTIVDARNQAEKIKIGRPLMKRSVPPASKKKEEPNQLSQVEQAKQQLAKNEYFHFFCDFVLGEEVTKDKFGTKSEEAISPATSETSI